MNNCIDKHKFIFVLFIFLAFPVHADWVEFGAGTNCVSNNASFTIEGKVTSSSPELSSYINLKNGFTQLPEGINKVECQLKTVLVKAVVGVTLPGNGQCMGGGWVSIGSLKFNNIEVIKYNGQFNSFCGGENVLVKLEVTEQTPTSIKFNACSASEWTWEKGYVDYSCQTEVINLAENSQNEKRIKKSN